MTDIVMPTNGESVLTHAASSLAGAAEALSRLSNAKSQASRAPTPKRGLSRSEAAEYIGVVASTFDKMVSQNQMPGPIRIGSRTIWDIKAIDGAFEALSETEESNPWDNWR